MLTSRDLDLELNPAKVESSEELQKNALQLRIVAKVFVDDICASSASIPPAFRKICSIVIPPIQFLPFLPSSMASGWQAANQGGADINSSPSALR
jgi:hypothetical protein